MSSFLNFLHCFCELQQNLHVRDWNSKIFDFQPALIYMKSQTLHLNQPYFPFFNGKGSLRTSAASIMTSSTSTVSLNPVRITSEKTIHLRRNSNVHIQILHDMVSSLLLMRKLRHSTTQELKELCCKTWISTLNNP